jgi:hypothetical protein
VPANHIDVTEPKPDPNATLRQRESGSQSVPETENQPPQTNATPSSPQPARTLTRCPRCSCELRTDNLKKHLSSRCPARDTVATVRGVQSSPQKATLRTTTPQPKLKKSRPRTSTPDEDTLEIRRMFDQYATGQSSYEAIFGERYVGQTRRDSDGSFGSIPLHDDYGDEADAD